MGSQDLSLVFFTILTQMAVGLAVIVAVLRPATTDGANAGGPDLAGRREWAAVLAMLVAAVAAAFFHLGQPLGFIRMAVNLDTSWLSREIVIFGIFGLLVLVALVLAWTGKAPRWLTALTATIGVLGTIASGLTYAPPSMPALNNGLPLALFLLTVAVLGPAIASYLIDEPGQATCRRVLTYALVAALVVWLLMPSIWLSGGAVEHETGTAFLTSWGYWVQLAGLVAGLTVLWSLRKIPWWLPVVLAIAAFAGRVVFFSATTTTAAHIGWPF